MIIGTPKEIKTEESRVGLTPSGVRYLKAKDHRILIQQSAGVGSGFSDDDYLNAGAEIAPDAAALYAQSELIVKVKEPLEAEYALLKPSHTLFTYLHLAANETLTKTLLDKGVTAFAYESLEKEGRLPLLEPMSEIAGRIAALAGANLLSHAAGGSGVLISGVTGVAPANVVVIGAGNVGMNAAKIASGMGAQVTLLDLDSHRLAHAEEVLERNVTTRYSTPENLTALLPMADLVIGAVLLKDARTPRVITEAMIKSMPEGSVFVDVSIDQGGCSETSRPTTHKEPTYVLHGVTHYCVANMPGAFARTATLALTANTLPYVALLADKGKAVIQSNEPLKKALNLSGGSLHNEAIGQTFGLKCTPLS